MGGVWKKGPGAGLFKSLNDVSAVAWQTSLQTTRRDHLCKGLQGLGSLWGAGVAQLQ